MNSMKQKITALKGSNNSYLKDKISNELFFKVNDKSKS